VSLGSPIILQYLGAGRAAGLRRPDITRRQGRQRVAPGISDPEVTPLLPVFAGSLIWIHATVPQELSGIDTVCVFERLACPQ